MELFELAKAQLTRSNADRRHPFRYCYVATSGDFPELRMVVKRNFGPDWSVLFFTDARTPKVEQIRNEDRVSVLFYDDKKLLQIRMKGRAVLIDEEHEDYGRYVDQVNASPAQSDYKSIQAPGTEVSGEKDIKWGDALHFMAIRIEPDYLDILKLGKEQHTRRAYVRDGAEWQEKILVP